MVGAAFQTQGRGSRGNTWVAKEGNLFMSVALLRSSMPSDLKLESTSIYLAFLMKELLASKGSKVWIKWPNDFYVGERKIGGVITNLIGDTLVGGIGINVSDSPEPFGKLDVSAEPYDLTKEYGEVLKKLPTWKQIFSKFEIEFENSREYFTHNNNEKIALKRAVLCDDGSLMCDGQRIYSLR
jgi:BirA family transcriptional regulator, biotin operon repressor / biotin---[acetyl-CoA-carboxylase] ligase